MAANRSVLGDNPLNQTTSDIQAGPDEQQKATEAQQHRRHHGHKKLRKTSALVRSLQHRHLVAQKPERQQPPHDDQQ
eukprot:CAMPEP_0183561024 /NCGR_PEP_ID=MMETSP0371-20130417/96485_1 /TAXON_ID=268820 /ORGANISM="Peridinium aciculiferum, Strain PAER-2" /LENGTH=76 /DNA_ID=CAMNT_0025769429 /DNA_START=135 /DNA_END=366 /DNA_ORIENTATION=+